jgi:hypothetical protein
MFRFQVCGRRKPPRPSATPPWQGGEFNMNALIKVAIVLSSYYHNSPPCQGGGRGWLG